MATRPARKTPPGATSNRHARRSRAPQDGSSEHAGRWLERPGNRPPRRMAVAPAFGLTNRIRPTGSLPLLSVCPGGVQALRGSAPGPCPRALRSALAFLPARRASPQIRYCPPDASLAGLHSQFIQRIQLARQAVDYASERGTLFHDRPQRSLTAASERQVEKRAKPLSGHEKPPFVGLPCQNLFRTVATCAEMCRLVGKITDRWEILPFARGGKTCSRDVQRCCLMERDE